MDRRTAQLEIGLKEILTEKGIANQINRVGSMISLHFCEESVVDFESALVGDNDTFKHFFHHMLSNGIYLPPSPYESWFVCTEIGDEEIATTLEVVR